MIETGFHRWDIAALLDASDLFVLTTMLEGGLPLSVMEAMAKEHHDRFKTAVSLTRKIPEKLLDGRVMTATMAQSGGLVDEICSLNHAVTLASGRTDKDASSPQEVEVVLYRKGLETARSVYDTIPNQPLQATALPLSIPGLDRTRQGGFWYLWMSDPTLTRLTGK